MFTNDPQVDNDTRCNTESFEISNGFYNKRGIFENVLPGIVIICSKSELRSTAKPITNLFIPSKKRAAKICYYKGDAFVRYLPAVMHFMPRKPQVLKHIAQRLAKYKRWRALANYSFVRKADFALRRNPPE